MTTSKSTGAGIYAACRLGLAMTALARRCVQALPHGLQARCEAAQLFQMEGGELRQPTLAQSCEAQADEALVVGIRCSSNRW